MTTGSTAVIAPASSFASLPRFDRPTFLMCAPEWYDVNYVINPWMAGNLHQSSRDAAFAQWKTLHQHMQQIADVRLLHARQGSPDMTFVGHTAVVQHGVATISSFAHTQRQTEEQHLRRWFRDTGFLVWDTPRETAFEGEGDAVFNATGDHLWAAHGSRTCKQSHRHLADAWHTPVTSLKLVDPRFFHLDLCFVPLSGGELLYFPEAFDADSLAKIEAAYDADKRIVVSELEAVQFGCNVINVGRHILMGKVDSDLAQRLKNYRYNVTELDLSEFILGGGSAKSLVLRLSDMAVTHAVRA
ncbi:MAG: amidinotransferase [Acidobacteriales bacterium 59-55]|nr:amidinotransferase [Terriglobales bacterium]OJV41042.1 MAG: amidinotransferase [Acidobacteriales bacterium 59-55]